MKPHLSGIPTDIFLVLLIAVMNMINICATSLAVLHIRRFHMKSRQRAQEEVRRQTRRQTRGQARKAARWSQRRHTDVSTQTIQVPSTPNGQRFLQTTPEVNVTTRTTDAVSSTDQYPSSRSRSTFSRSSLASTREPTNLSGETLVDDLSRSDDSSAMTLIDVMGSNSDIEVSHLRRRRRRISGRA